MNTESLSRRDSLRRYLPPVIFFLCGAVFLFWRARFGYCYHDEPFTVSLASRILHGDTLLVDDWNGAQNTGILILPVYALLHRLLGGTEGILLAMRTVYCLSWLTALIFLWKKLEPVGSSRYVAVVYLLLFSPLDYMTLSYTSISLMCVTAIAAITYADVLEAKGSPVKIGLTLGLLMTVSTLCYPHLALLFLLYAAALIVGAIYFKRKGSDRHIYYSRVLLPMISAVIFFAVAYCVYIFIGKGDRPLLENIAEIFNSPKHQSKGAIEAIGQICSSIGWKYPGGMLLLTGIALLPFKRRDILRPVLLAIGLWLYSLSLIWVYIAPNVQFNGQMRNIAFFGLLAYALMDSKPRKLLCAFYGISAVYIYAVYLGTDTGILAISMCMSVAGAAAVIILLLLARELAGQLKITSAVIAALAVTISALEAAEKYGIVVNVMVINVLVAAIILLLVWELIHSRRNAAAAIAILAVAAQIGAEVRVRFDFTYYDETLSELTETIDRGPAKGLRTTGENKADYDELLAAFDSLTDGMKLDGKTLLSASEIISLYADMDYDTYSTWLYDISAEQMWERQEKYFALNNRDMPDYIFFNKPIPNNMDISGYEVYEQGKYTLLAKSEE